MVNLRNLELDYITSTFKLIFDTDLILINQPEAKDVGTMVFMNVDEKSIFILFIGTLCVKSDWRVVKMAQIIAHNGYKAT